MKVQTKITKSELVVIANKLYREHNARSTEQEISEWFDEHFVDNGTPVWKWLRLLFNEKAGFDFPYTPSGGYDAFKEICLWCEANGYNY